MFIKYVLMLILSLIAAAAGAYAAFLFVVSPRVDKEELHATVRRNLRCVRRTPGDDVTRKKQGNLKSVVELHECESAVEKTAQAENECPDETMKKQRERTTQKKKLKRPKNS